MGVWDDMADLEHLKAPSICVAEAEMLLAWLCVRTGRVTNMLIQKVRTSTKNAKWNDALLQWP